MPLGPRWRRQVGVGGHVLGDADPVGCRAALILSRHAAAEERAEDAHLGLLAAALAS